MYGFEPSFYLIENIQPWQQLRTSAVTEMVIPKKDL
jgi:hypothetical protein